MTTLSQIIVDLLDEFPPLRDDDQRLLINVWAKQYGKENLDKPTTMREALKIIQQELANPNTIVTTRQNLQRDFVQFRGKKWNERHDKAIETRNQIRENTYGK